MSSFKAKTVENLSRTSFACLGLVPLRSAELEMDDTKPAGRTVVYATASSTPQLIKMTIEKDSMKHDIKAGASISHSSGGKIPYGLVLLPRYICITQY